MPRQVRQGAADAAKKPRPGSPPARSLFSLGNRLDLPLKLVRSDAEISSTLPKRRSAWIPKGRLTEERIRTEAGGGRHERQRDEAA